MKGRGKQNLLIHPHPHPPPSRGGGEKKFKKSKKGGIA